LDIKNEKWFIDLNNTESIYMWYPNDINGKSDKYASAVRKILDPTNLSKSIGYIQAKIPKDSLSSVLETGKVTEDTQVVIINSQNEIIASTLNLKIDTNGLTANILSKISPYEYNNNQCRELEIDGLSYLVGINKINFTDWHYLQLTPYSSIKTLSSRSVKQFLYITIIALPLFVVFALFFFRYTSKRIHYVIGNLDAIAQHHILEESTTVKGNDFENLNNSFNMMVKRLDKLLEERYQLGMEIKTLEIKTLQAQINPHFLYNTLNIINNLGLKNNIPEISIMVDSLAKFYSLSLSKGNDLIPIESEIEIVRSYMAIQNMRFRDCAKLMISIPKELAEFKTPKLILQPIIENALWHGILESEAKTGIIKLNITLEGDDILFTVHDNGKGMTTEKLERILIEDSLDVHHGYGTKNINDRLKIMFGDKYGLTYESQHNKGTTVYVRIPKTI